MMQNRTALIIAGAVIAFLLQIILAPNIVILGARPNFFIVYVLIVAMVSPAPSTYVLAFVLGLVGDLLGYGPVGALSFLLVAASFLVARAFKTFNNDTIFVPLIILVAFCILIECAYAAFLMTCGLDISPIDAFIARALPCAIYDSVIGLVLYPLLSRFLTPTKQQFGSVSGLHLS